MEIKQWKMDEIGIIVSSSRHGANLEAINMLHGETYRHTHFIDKIWWALNFQYLAMM